MQLLKKNISELFMPNFFFLKTVSKLTISSQSKINRARVSVKISSIPAEEKLLPLPPLLCYQCTNQNMLYWHDLAVGQKLKIQTDFRTRNIVFIVVQEGIDYVNLRYLWIHAFVTVLISDNVFNLNLTPKQSDGKRSYIYSLFSVLGKVFL